MNPPRSAFQRCCLILLLATTPSVLGGDDDDQHKLAGFYGASDDDFYVDDSSCTASQCASGSSSCGYVSVSGTNEWICAVMGSSDGKAVSGCSYGGTPKSGFTQSSPYTGTWTGTAATSTGTCPWSGKEIARIDAGTSNSNGAGISLAMEKECSSYGAGFDAFVSVGGGDIKNDKLNVECSNANDDATARVYFVCCKPGDCDSCVDPVVSGSGSDDDPTNDIATSTTTSSSTGTSGAAAVAGSVGAVAVLGAVSLVALKIRSEHTTTEMELHQVLQQDEIGNL